MNSSPEIFPIARPLWWRSQSAAYTFSIATIGAAVVVKSFLPAPGSPALLFFAAIMLCAWWGGFGAGVLAAFLAADEGTTIGMRQTIRALKREYQKLGRLVTEHDFGSYLALARGTG